MEITACGPHPFVCKYYKLYIQQISERSRLYSGRDGPECATMYLFRYVFLSNIRWFDITAFASKAPKVQEVVEITASGPLPFVCKYYKLYIQQIPERSRLYSGIDGPECETMYRFRYVFLSNKIARSSEQNGLCPTSFFRKMLQTIYTANLKKELAQVRGVMGQNV